MIFIILLLSVGVYSGPTPPPQLDWRDMGAVLPVPEPSGCGVQPALINGLDAISAKFAIHSNVLAQLSRQQIYDCNDDNWCPCGQIDTNTTTIYEMIQRTNLSYYLEAESDYPYTEKCDHKCNRTQTKTTYYLITWATSEDDLNREDLLMDWIQKGPLVVNVNVDCDDFKLYTGGVLDTNDCKGPPNYNLLLVGYGTDQQSNQDFWIARNSWGVAWGEQGYVRLIRDKNTIGIGNGFILPV